MKGKAEIVLQSSTFVCLPDMFLYPAMGFHSIELHPLYTVPSASSFIYPHTPLSQSAQQLNPPSTTPVWDSNLVFWTSKTQ
eukprot:1701150-Ditylum_brightwellii.AAC.1